MWEDQFERDRALLCARDQKKGGNVKFRQLASLNQESQVQNEGQSCMPSPGIAPESRLVLEVAVSVRRYVRYYVQAGLGMPFRCAILSQKLPMRPAVRAGDR